MDKTFSRQVFLWLAQIARDKQLSGTGARLAIVLSGYMNRETGDAWPSVPRLAGDLGMVENSVRNALKALAAAGHLAIEAGGGSRSNRYRMVLKDAPGPCNEMQGEVAAPLQNPEPHPCKDLHPTPANPCADPCKDLHPNHYSNHLNEPYEREEPSLPSLSHGRDLPSEGARAKPRPSPGKNPPEGFGRFWAAYPRHVGKLAAEKAFAKAVNGGASPEEIISAAERFASERNRELDPAKRERFTPHPATWLTGGRWADDPQETPAPFGLPAFAGDVRGFPQRGGAAREGHGFRVMRVGEFA